MATLSTKDSILSTHTISPANDDNNNTQESPSPSISASSPPQSYTYYHAGPLFTLAELHTNALLARQISRISSKKYHPILPQDLEQRDLSPHSIRDEDIRALLSCDLALFTYDGSELDSGTVVEFMLAKMADVPCVILRTDFRGAGDQSQTGDGKKGDGWNLMSSNWPRCVTVSVDAMVSYKAALARVLSSDTTSQGGGKRKEMVTAGDIMIDEVARKVVDGFETVLKEKPRLPKELRESVYQWLAIMPGLKNALPGNEGKDGQRRNIEAFKTLCEEKVKKGLL